MDDTLKQAIAQRRLVELRYHGYSRIVEPHAYGRNRRGDDVIRCFQLVGGSESGEGAGWKLLRVREAARRVLLETEFVPRSGFRAEDPAMVEVYAHV